ncbi:MAG: cation:proton antiporter [Chromatocurvus sp.]
MSFLTEIFVFLLAAVLVVTLCKYLGLSSVIGYLLAGALIGPAGVGVIGNAIEILHFAEFGVVLLLFLIGLELQPRRLWVMRRAVFLLGSLQLGASTLVLAGLMLLALPLSPLVAGILAFSLALSSTAFVLQLLGEQKKLNRPHGRAAFGVLLMQDIAVIPAIATLALFGPAATGDGLDPVMIALVAIGMVLARFTLRPLLRLVAATGIHELFLATSLAIVTGSALAMDHAGLSMGLGAFIAGMLVADSEYRHQLETDVMPFKGLLLGLFFMAVGMSADLKLLFDSPLLVLGLVAALVGVKTLVLWPIARWYGLPNDEALRCAAVLAQGGEFAFVLLTASVSASLVSESVAGIAVVVVTLSMAVTPFLGAVIERLLVDRTSPRPFDVPDHDARPVVIAGYGRFGQIISRILRLRGIPFTVLEVSAAQVDFVRQFGNEIYYGDATRLDLLNTARLREARVLVIAMDGVEDSLRLARLVREDFPNVAILARARNRHHELWLREIGVRYVIRETLLSGLALAREVLEVLGVAPTAAEEAISVFRDHDEKLLQRQLAVFHDEAALRQSAQDAAAELETLFADDVDDEARIGEPSSAAKEAH